MFDQFKPIMQNGERCIVVEGGKPEYVLMRFRDYVSLVSGKPASPVATASLVGEPSPVWERANAELSEVTGRASLPHFEAQLAGDPIPPPVDPTAIRLEDLAL